VAVGITKPWELLDQGPAVVAQADVPVELPLQPQATATDTVAPASDAPVPAVRPALSRNELTLERAEGDLSGVTATATTGWLVTKWQPGPAEFQFARSIPNVKDLGSSCTGGVVLAEGADAFALALPERTRTSRGTRVLLLRLFAKGAPVTIPVRAEVGSTGEVALVSTDAFRLDPGHYALTVDVMGRAGTFVFCVEPAFRMVDYSLLTLMPAGVDSAAARKQLLRDLRFN